MKKHILLLFFAVLWVTQMPAQNYIVSSLATPGSATFTSDKIVDGTITLPFVAGTHAIPVETNQNATVTCDADWCEASFADNTLTLSVTENSSEYARTAVVAVRSKDFHPLLITVKQESRLVFAVISDTHVGNSYGGRYVEKVSQTLQNLTGKGKLDALAVVGDITDHGDTGQYKEFVQILGNSENFINPIDNFLFMMGNHDNYNSSGQSNYRSGLKAFNRNLSYPLDQYVLIKGYPFITISVRGGANNDDNSGNGTTSYPDAVLRTLERYLKQASEDAPGKPIFVFAHVAPRNTCYSTWGDLEGAAWAMWRLNSVLNDYPQVVAFCGHSHYPLGDPRSIHQGANPNSTNQNYYTVINTASITYSEINPGAVEAGIHPEGFKDVTEGLILVEQANGDIEIQRYDTYRNVEIDPEHRWVLKAPFDGSMFEYADIRDIDDNPNNVPLRDGLPAPVFYKSAELSLDIYPNDVTVSFPQATDNECVFRYKVRLLKDGTEVQSAFVFSQFYLTTDMPHTLSYTFEGLTEGAKYSAEVIAYDSWDNQSVPLATTFTTPTDDAPAPEPIGWWTFDNPDDLLACTGVATLKGATHSKGNVTVCEELAESGITAVAGPEEDNGAISVPKYSSLLMTSNLEDTNIRTYSFLMDIHVEDFSDFNVLYQNDLTNTKDGSLFINKDGQVGKNVSGLGYNGWINSTGWHRVVFVVRDCKAKLYINGSLVGQSSSASVENWLMSKGLLFFGDENGEELLTKVAEIRFWNKALTNGQVEKLGTVIPGVNPSEIVIPEALGVWTFDNTDDLLAGTGVATLTPTTHYANNSASSPSPLVTEQASLADANITIVTGPAESNGALHIPYGSSLLMKSNLSVTEIGTYTILWDVKGENLSTYVPLLQNSLTNSKDGSLFFNQNKIGLGGSLGYNGSINNNQWYRIVFVVEAPNKARLYVNGSMVSSCEHNNAYNQHWKLTTGALFFADNDGEEKALDTAEIRFWNEALNTAQVAKLGVVGTE